MIWGCYVHVPWCRAVCPYCNFAVRREPADPPFDAFVDQILAELSARRVDVVGPAHTVFLGGGTPSRLPAVALGRLLAGIARAPGAEVSAEANPEDVTPAWLGGALDAGVNRVSLGVQTFEPRHARRLGRGHTSPQAEGAARRIAASGVRSWSMDLIFAVPGQTLEDLDADIDRLLALDPPHVALYGLTLEPGTPLGRAAERGRLTAVEPELWRQMYDRIVERLTAAGIERYEVSNFARPGHESVHNRGYWRDRPYLGLGPGAHGFRPDGTRYRNTPEVDRWLRGGWTEADERPTPHQAAVDLLVGALRCREGLDLRRLASRTGHRLEPAIPLALAKAGLLTFDDDHCRLTAAGFPLADGITNRLVDALAPVAGRNTG